uniref:ATP synthase F0 subunit 9 n=1 Tax=Paropyrum anemonoides TaxID=432641 RepID=UPI0023F2FAEC|nr:ATP synthase F0 subunit 9 [Paropyrum anemonoides]WDV09955.1 ATP synthase F0 subunit 9 [Paropyrum anemonoides]
MLEGAKSIGAGAATIASAGAAVGIGNVFSSFRGSKSFIGETIIWLCHFGLCSNRSYCIVCPNDGIFDPIRILKKKMKKTWLILGYMIFFFLMRPLFRYLRFWVGWAIICQVFECPSYHVVGALG